MSGPAAPSPAPNGPASDLAMAPKTTILLLASFGEFYRQEVGAEEDVHRTLPFFGTALGIVIGALAYAAGRLPKWPDLITHRAWLATNVSSILLDLAVFEAGCLLVWLSLAIARRDYQRIGPETAPRARQAELQAYYSGQGVTGEQQDRELVQDMRQVLLDFYTAVTPVNRDLNQRRYKFRALASSHLVRSLIWALGATRVIFMGDADGVVVIPREAEETVPQHKPSGTVTYTQSSGADVWPARR